MLTLALVLALCALSEGAEPGTFGYELSQLEGVASIDVIAQSTNVFAEKYVVWFEQPIDWKSSAGTFLQRVEIGFKGYDSVNVVYVGGYGLSPSYFAYDDRNELARFYNANCIKIEYRYFSKSVPEGLSEDSLDLWEYLNGYNASSDFHNIIEQLRGILSGSWVFSGMSKGGQAANIFAYYYPNDADAYVSYVAPFCDGNNDARLTEAVYTSIGSERYGEAQAEEYRDMLLRFQVEMIRNRDYLQPELSLITSEDAARYPFRTVSHDFEERVADLPVTVWQYYQNFASFDEVLKMPHETSADKETYLEAMLSAFRGAGVSVKSADVFSYFPYRYQARTENGNYGVSLKYLREACEREGLSLVTTVEEEREFEARLTFTDEQLDAWKYDASLRSEMIDWTHTTESKVIMIYGNSDPWYFVRLPDAYDNPNVHIYTLPGSHSVYIGSMPAEQKESVLLMLDEWLEAERVPDTQSSSGGCEAGLFGVLCVPVVLGLMTRRKFLR